MFARIGNDVCYDKTQQKCTAGLGGREPGRQFQKLLKSRRRNERFDSRLGGRLGTEHQDESKDIVWFQTCVLEKTRRHSHTKNSS